MVSDSVACSVTCGAISTLPSLTRQHHGDLLDIRVARDIWQRDEPRKASNAAGFTVSQPGNSIQW